MVGGRGEVGGKGEGTAPSTPSRAACGVKLVQGNHVGYKFSLSVTVQVGAS